MSDDDPTPPQEPPRRTRRSIGFAPVEELPIIEGGGATWAAGGTILPPDWWSWSW